MEYYDLKSLKMIAQGGEAEIYDIGENKVLRVLRINNGKTFETEKILFPTLQEHHINIPLTYEYILVDGRPAEVMQKITGETMLEELTHQPFKIVNEIKKLARMQIDISNIEIESTLTSIQDTMNYFIEKPPLMEKKLIDFTLSLFEELPKNSQMCHGDFHPGNILIQDGKYYIIDWSGAYRSDFLSDIAHTYLLLKHVPKIPGQSRMQHTMLGFTGTFIAKVYLNEIYKLKNFDRALFSKWTVIMAFLRVYFGMPSEISERINYIQKCYELNLRNVNAAIWYRNI